tara:strand:- start:59 stop:238 length:180 start_codon:yes stop_codon:yes gene_type:complete
MAQKSAISPIWARISRLWDKNAIPGIKKNTDLGIKISAKPFANPHDSYFLLSIEFLLAI